MSPSKNKIRIKDIAEKARVSMGTVDRVLHNRGEVKEETRERVLKIVDEMGYTPNLLARSLASKKTYRFAAIIPDASDNNPYWNKPLEGIVRGAHEIKDYNAFVDTFTFNATDKESFIRACKQAMDSNPAGIVLDPVFKDPSYDYTLELDKRSIPYVYVDTDLEKGKRLAYYGQDATQSGQVAAKILSGILPQKSLILILKLANKGITSHHVKKREKGFKDFFYQTETLDAEFVSADIDLLEKNNPGKVLKSLFKSYQNINGIYVPNSRSFKVAEWMVENNKEKFPLLGYDLIDQNVDFLKKGVIDFLIAQKPEEQGYNSVLSLFNHVVARKEIKKTNFSAIDIIIKENIEFYY